MPKPSTANAAASAVAIVLLIAMVSIAAELLDPVHFWVNAIAGYLFTIPLAVAAWTGVLFRGKDGVDVDRTTWLEWIVIFVIGFVLSALFVAMDRAVQHPGVSLAFTIGAIAMTLIALPSAVRAWLLQVFRVNDEKRQTDA